MGQCFRLHDGQALIRRQILVLFLHQTDQGIDGLALCTPVVMEMEEFRRRFTAMAGQLTEEEYERTLEVTRTRFGAAFGGLARLALVVFLDNNEVVVRATQLSVVRMNIPVVTEAAWRGSLYQLFGAAHGEEGCPYADIMQGIVPGDFEVILPP